MSKRRKFGAEFKRGAVEQASEPVVKPPRRRWIFPGIFRWHKKGTWVDA